MLEKEEIRGVVGAPWNSLHGTRKEEKVSKREVRFGRIDFQGLRFFLEKTEGRVSRKELIELICLFFRSKGLPFGRLRVEFRQTRRPTSIIDGEERLVWGLMHHNQNRVEIFVNTERNPMTWKDVIETLFHELDHVAWELEGKVFDNTVPYKDRQHEIRANLTGQRWLRRVKIGFKARPCQGSMVPHT